MLIFNAIKKGRELEVIIVLLEQTLNSAAVARPAMR
jgi:hypothetical protein